MLKPELRAAADRLNAVLAGVDDDTARAASGLPGWSRGHVMAHLANFSNAMTRQVEQALAGRLVEMYDGGRPARDAAIETDSGESAQQLKENVAAATGNLIAAYEKVDDWTRPVTYRNSDLTATAYCGWRELEIHTIDLALQPTSDDWSEEFCLHLLDFLRPRTPEGIKLVLDAGTTKWENGDGPVQIVEGRLTDLTAWIAGRQPRQPLAGDLPELKPWP